MECNSQVFHYLSLNPKQNKQNPIFTSRFLHVEFPQRTILPSCKFTTPICITPISRFNTICFGGLFYISSSASLSQDTSVSTMSQDWADFERESIKRIGQPGQPTAFQEYGIQFLTGLMQGSPAQGKIDTDELAHQILQSGQSLADTWWDFLNLFFSAASSTSNDSSHERLVSLVFALANHVSRKTTADPSKDREVDSLFKNLTQFGMVAREHWNGE
jgi:hypothetical protein